ncbi:MAG: hypothetical protein KDD25_09775, partial [Bdellovibrionales bacterium]|nr:hypothetical protein [Bdellovibrionales bacterium]
MIKLFILMGLLGFSLSANCDSHTRQIESGAIELGQIFFKNSAEIKEALSQAGIDEGANLFGGTV